VFCSSLQLLCETFFGMVNIWRVNAGDAGRNEYRLGVKRHSCLSDFDPN
jgi:hypothetical protein